MSHDIKEGRPASDQKTVLGACPHDCPDTCALVANATVTWVPLPDVIAGKDGAVPPPPHPPSSIATQSPRTRSICARILALPLTRIDADVRDGNGDPDTLMLAMHVGDCRPRYKGKCAKPEY